MSCRRLAAAPLAVALACSFAAGAAASPASVALRAKGSHQIYSLDRDEAVATFREAIAADPNDSGAYRGLATALWLSITFRRGNMTVDDYLGSGVSRPSTPTAPAPADTVAAFNDAIGRAITLARARLDANARDPDAHYQLGAAVGLRASYTATVEGRVVGAFRAAREAFDEHEQVLSIDPKRKDAGLIVGTYRYIVSTLSLPVRWMAYVVGFGGDKERGLQMIEEAAAYPGDNQNDAQFALILLYNREKRYDDALKLMASLRERYPRNRLMWLEAGSTLLRAGRAADAERMLTEGITRFANDTRTRMFGEDAIWYYKRGAARAAITRSPDGSNAARADLKRALDTEGRKWVHGRAHLELGKIALNAGDRGTARQELQQAAALCDSDNDGLSAAEARRLIK